jgi:hypothetical protein
MAATDAKIYPIKNQAYRVTFPILDNTGSLVAGATGLDSEFSKDISTFTDCTNEATEIATASGIYYLDLTATEMNADTVAVIVKTSTTNAKTTTLVFYPLEAGDIFVNVTQWAGTANTTGDIAIKTQLAKTTHITGFNDISQANVQTELVTYGALKPTVAARTLDVSAGGEAGVDWANIGSPATANALSATTISSSQVAASVTAPVTVGTNSDKTGYSLTAAYDPAKTAAQVGSAMTLTPAYDAAKTASSQASVDTVATYVDTEVAAIKAKTDQMVFTAGKIDANATATVSPSDMTGIADAVLKRDWTSVTGEAAYSLLNAARMIRNKWATPSGVLTVYAEDGTTVKWTRTLAVDPTATPIVGQT